MEKMRGYQCRQLANSLYAQEVGGFEVVGLESMR